MVSPPQLDLKPTTNFRDERGSCSCSGIMSSGTCRCYHPSGMLSSSSSLILEGEHGEKVSESFSLKNVTSFPEDHSHKECHHCLETRRAKDDDATMSPCHCEIIPSSRRQRLLRRNCSCCCCNPLRETGRPSLSSESMLMDVINCSEDRLADWNKQTCPSSRAISINSCFYSCADDNSVTDQSNDNANHLQSDKYLVKTEKSSSSSNKSVCCSCGSNLRMGESEIKCFTNGHVDYCKRERNIGDGESSLDYSKSMGKGDGGGRGGYKGKNMGLLLGGDRRTWLLFATLLFLSLAGSATSFAGIDDDDDDMGGMSPFTTYTRHRRSTESLSFLHDALSLIPSNYSIHEPPPTNNSEATQVDFSVLIMNVRDIKELNEGYGDLELSLEMNLRIYWKDTRLSHLADRSGNKFIVLNPILLDKIWHPDIFIDHVKGVAQPALISKPASLRVYPDSSVRYSARITVTMACQMDFHYYPADTQRCSVDMKSYAYSNKILALDWREGKGALLVEYLELPNFDVALDTTQNFMVNTSSGSYSGIRFTILLRRKLSYHLIQTYLPSTLFIIVSWLSFLVPPESVPGRMALCMTTLLTLTAMFSAVRQNTPNVSYVKALDIWMVVCIIFVFLTLVEYTVLLKLKSKKPKPKPPQSAHHSERAVSAPVNQQQQQQPPPATRWTIPALQYTSDNSNFKFRGCKNNDDIINENGSTNGEMRHRENGDTGLGGAGGDGVNIMSVPPTTPQLSTPLAPPPSAHPPTPHPPPPPIIYGPGERPLNKYELAAKKIEKFTSAVIPTLFVIFNFIYWPWLIESADYYHQEKSTTIFKSI